MHVKSAEIAQASVTHAYNYRCHERLSKVLLQY